MRRPNPEELTKQIARAEGNGHTFSRMRSDPQRENKMYTEKATLQQQSGEAEVFHMDCLVCGRAIIWWPFKFTGSALDSGCD